MKTQRTHSRHLPFARQLLIATAVAGALGLTTTANAEQSLSADLREARIEGQIVGAYTLNRHLNPFEIEVDVEGSTATLTGEVEEAVDKELAEQIALGVNGIAKVDNRIAVNPDYQSKPAASGKRDFGTAVTDATTTASVKSKLLWNQHTDGLDIEVTTRNGVVTLTGSADSAASKELAERLAANTDGVRDVRNELRVAADSGADRSDAEGVDRATEAVSDAWITSKGKTTLLLSRNIAGSHINVDTRDGVVTLAGRVDSGAERDLAIKVAEEIRGVKAVKAGDLEVRS